MKCGIVGLPNVGKSTLFNALTKAGIAAENYPFCTIEPNVGIVPVPDRRLEVIAEIEQPQKVVPAVVEFVDIEDLLRRLWQRHRNESVRFWRLVTHCRHDDNLRSLR